MTIIPETKERFILHLRIPGWSRENHLSVNGRDAGIPLPGSYFSLDRQWKKGDVLELMMDLSLHFWVGEKELTGKTSIYRCPVLLAYDRYSNSMNLDDVPTLNANILEEELVSWSGWLRPWVLLKLRTKDDRELLLCDFASAGASGTPYRSCLPVAEVYPVAFSHSNPMRIGRRQSVQNE